MGAGDRTPTFGFHAYRRLSRIFAPSLRDGSEKTETFASLAGLVCISACPSAWAARCSYLPPTATTEKIILWMSKSLRRKCDPSVWDFQADPPVPWPETSNPFVQEAPL